MAYTTSNVLKTQLVVNLCITTFINPKTPCISMMMMMKDIPTWLKRCHNTKTLLEFLQNDCCN